MHEHFFLLLRCVGEGNDIFIRLNVSILQYPVADLFLDLLVTHPDNLVGLDVRELKVDLVSHDFLFLVRVNDAVDCPLQDEIGTQFFSPLFGGFR